MAGVESSHGPFETVHLGKIGIPNLPRARFMHAPEGFRAAVKPFFYQYLFRFHGLRTLLSFEPEQYVLAPLTDVFPTLDTYPVVLGTPFAPARAAIERDDSGARFTSIESARLVGLTYTPMLQRLLTRWQARLYGTLESSSATDAQFGPLPAPDDAVRSLPDPDLDMAVWSSPLCRVRVEDGRLSAGEWPVRLIDLAGLDLGGRDSDRTVTSAVSADRFGGRACADLEPIYRAYADALLDNGHIDARVTASPSDLFDNGTPIPAIARQLYRDSGDAVLRFGDPFRAERPDSYYSWLNEPLERGAVSSSEVADMYDATGDDSVGAHADRGPAVDVVTRLWYELWKTRPDLMTAFPSILGDHRGAFLHWAERYGQAEYGVPRGLCLRQGGRELGAEAPPGAPGSTSPDDKPFGVNLAGHFGSEKGVGEAVRATLRSLHAAGIPYVLNDFRDEGSANVDTSVGAFSEENPYAINLITLGVDQVPVFAQRRGADYFAGRRTVGHWAWELADFPEELRPAFRFFDEVWAASPFVAEALSRVSPVPVATIPYAIAVDGLPDQPLRRYPGLPPNTFVFLFAFDFASWLARKNPLGLIAAFKRAFRPDDDVLLVLKCAHSESAPADLDAVQEAARGANVRITDAVLSREQVRALMRRADCYVSLHRAEGFGLPLAEAMSLEKAVIATGYSGNLAFMNDENSFLVRHTLAAIEQDHGPYKKGFVWAEPDLDHAAELMRRVFDDRDLARERGRCARRHVIATLAPDVVGRLVKRRIERAAAV